MGLIAQLKKKKAGEKRQAADIAAEKPMVTGTYGTFGKSFTVVIRYVSFGADTTLVANLCHDGPDGLQPFLAYTGYNGFGDRLATLHSAPDEHLAPLALVENSKGYRSTSKGLRVPGVDGGGPSMIDFEDKGSLIKERYRFSVKVPTLDGAQGTSHVDTFEWRPVSMLKTPMVRQLFRLNSTIGGEGEEIVASWVEEPDPKKAGGKLGEFRYEGRGAGDEMGAQWKLVAALSAVAVCQLQIVAKQSADVLQKAFGKAVGLGSSFAG